MTKTTFTAALATAAVVLAGVPSAYAASPGDTVTFKVSTAGLDLRSPQGAQSMLRRIETAAGALCGGTPYIGDLDATHAWKVCVSHNVNQAVTQLGAPMVSEASHPAPTQTASIGR
jgi:UrcA family protein